ncbi:hypothetical protein [Nocardia sp. alder85J]|uniref:hypothetical protein n=1 Tax=Nocardia sp. alder85J TaxID=2862949 RepID=UPI001CD2BB7C|nr:hypothetical protein [Nocardia sp. alder85J]MCX4097716.1 hypothetical protein [Nocardia sp. alder85J]
MGAVLVEIPGSARLVLVEGVRHLDEPAAVFEGMLTGWANQQKSRMLAEATIVPRLALLRRYTALRNAENSTTTIPLGSTAPRPSNLLPRLSRFRRRRGCDV